MGRVVVVDPGATVVVDSGATVVVVEVASDGAAVVVASASVVDVVSGVEDGTALGAGSELHAPATNTTTIGRAIRSFTSACLHDAGGRGRFVGVARNATTLCLVHASQQVDAEDEEDNKAEYGRPR